MELSYAQGPVSQDTFKANNLFQMCSMPSDGGAKSEHLKADEICSIYLRGLTDGMFTMQLRENAGTKNCLGPENPTVVEAKAVFQAYVLTHPDSLQHSAGLIAALSLLYAHPCE